MKPTLAAVRNLLFDLPRQGKLAYCLLRDESVPPGPKLALLAAVGIVISPVDLPTWIPVLGELDVLALSVLAIKVFVEACPEELVKEHRAALSNRSSRFDRDLASALALARDQIGRLRQSRRRRRPVDLEELRRPA